MPLSLVGRDPESAFYAGQVARFGGPVLVLGSADGTVPFALAARGHDVTGVEPSAYLMAEAEARRATEPAASVQLVRADLRSLRLEQRFGTIIAPKNALALLPGADAVDAIIATVASHLSPDGGFIFEVNGLQGYSQLEGPQGRALFTAHLRERKGAQAIRRVRRATLTPNELEAALAGSGLEARERYADFDGSPWEDDSDRQVVVAGLRG